MCVLTPLGKSQKVKNRAAARMENYTANAIAYRKSEL